MADLIASNIEVYGPLAVFLLLMLSGIGIPLSEDLVVIPAGLFVGNGELPLWPTLLAAYCGVVGSDLLWFLICHRYGSHLLHRRWFKRLVHPRRLLEAKYQIERHGAWVIVMARFIPASRTPTITISGLLHLPLWRFALATAACVLVTAPLQLGLGFLIARGLGTQKTADLVAYVLAAVALVTAVVLARRWWLQQRRATAHRMPRARAVWLRRFRLPGLPRRAGPRQGRAAGEKCGP